MITKLIAIILTLSGADMHAVYMETAIVVVDKYATSQGLDQLGPYGVCLRIADFVKTDGRIYTDGGAHSYTLYDDSGEQPLFVDAQEYSAELVDACALVMHGAEY